MSPRRYPLTPMCATIKPTRATYMQVADVRLLDDWAVHLGQMFGNEVPYLVGSALIKPDHRDVDVRIVLDDDAYANLAACVSINRLNVCLSLWGKTVTGLPIDCQVQQQTEANRLYGRLGVPCRNALGISDWGKP